MTSLAGPLHRDDDWCDQYNDGYAWGNRGEFIACLISHLGMSAPLWRTLDTQTDITACDVTEVIAEHCDTHRTGLLMLGTDNASVVHLTTFAVAGDYFMEEAASIAGALGVPLLSREGCS
jgi:hypothetical protein